MNSNEANLANTDVYECVLLTGMTAIHLAARHGHIEVVYALKGSVSYNLTSSKVSKHTTTTT